MHHVVLSQHVQGISCKSVVKSKTSLCYKPSRSEAGVPSCVYRGITLMAIPFKITEWGKFICSCNLQTGWRSGVHVWSALQNQLLTSSNKVSCFVMQYCAAHFSCTSSSAATFSNPWLCTGLRSHPMQHVKKHRQEPLAPSLPDVPSQCLQGKSCLCCKNVGIKQDQVTANPIKVCGNSK